MVEVLQIILSFFVLVIVIGAFLGAISQVLRGLRSAVGWLVGHNDKGKDQ